MGQETRRWHGFATRHNRPQSLPSFSSDAPIPRRGGPGCPRLGASEGSLEPIRGRQQLETWGAWPMTDATGQVAASAAGGDGHWPSPVLPMSPRWLALVHPSMPCHDPPMSPWSRQDPPCALFSLLLIFRSRTEMRRCMPPLQPHSTGNSLLGWSRHSCHSSPTPHPSTKPSTLALVRSSSRAQTAGPAPDAGPPTALLVC